jgi:hypothetical protein
MMCLIWYGGGELCHAPEKFQYTFSDQLLEDIWETLNPLGSNGVFVILRGFIDESYDHKIFLFSALVAVGTEWRWLSRDWTACIAEWNKWLISEGRKPITQFHASECNSLDNEYEGWSREEQIEFMAELIKILGKSELDSVAFALDMDDFYKIFLNTRQMAKPDLLGMLYGMMTKFMIYRMAPQYVKADPSLRITLVHDRCQYDGAIAEAFRKAVEDEGFKERGSYTTITPASSPDVPPLQMADLIAHENFKETKRKYKQGSADLLPKVRGFSL